MSLESSSGPAVTFGLFDWVDADGVRDAGQLYRERRPCAEAPVAGPDEPTLAIARQLELDSQYVE